MRLKHTKPLVSATAFKLLNTSGLRRYTPTPISKTVCDHRLLATISDIWRQSSLLPLSLSSSPPSCTQLRIASRGMGPLSLRLLKDRSKSKTKFRWLLWQANLRYWKGESGNTQTSIRRVTMNASLSTQTSYLCSIGRRKQRSKKV